MQPAEDQTEPFSVLGLNSFGCIGQGKLLEPFVLKALNHEMYRNPSVTGYNAYRSCSSAARG